MLRKMYFKLCTLLQTHFDFQRCKLDILTLHTRNLTLFEGKDEDVRAVTWTEKRINQTLLR